MEEERGNSGLKAACGVSMCKNMSHGRGITKVSGKTYFHKAKGESYHRFRDLARQRGGYTSWGYKFSKS